MEQKNLSNVQKLTISGVVIALYVVILFMTQSFSFGAYQIRIGRAADGRQLCQEDRH